MQKYIEIAKTGKSTSNKKDVIPELLHEIIIGKYIHIALEAMYQDGILKQLIPTIKDIVDMKDPKKRFKDLWEHTKLVVRQTVPKKELRWAALFHDFGKPKSFYIKNGKISFHKHEHESVKYFKEFAKNFNIFSKEEYNKICFLIYNLGYVEGYESSWSDSAVRRIHKHMGEYFKDILLLSRADITTSYKSKKQKILFKIKELEKRALEIKAKDDIKNPLPKGIGNAIQDLGFKGKDIGSIKQMLEFKINQNELQPFMDIDFYIEYIKEKLSFVPNV